MIISSTAAIPLSIGRKTLCIFRLPAELGELIAVCMNSNKKNYKDNLIKIINYAKQNSYWQEIAEEMPNLGCSELV